MPKRNNPFGDISSVQMKTHVGTKQVDKGVDHITRMQSVYDKTHQLLFSGMKDFMIQSENNNNNSASFVRVDLKNEPSSLKRNNLKQMHLGNNCQLVSDDSEMETGECINTQGTFQSNNQGGYKVDCLSVNTCNSDFFYGRTPSEYSPTEFVSASSLIAKPLSSTQVRGNNIFERMKHAQMNMSSHLKTDGGACHSCTQPVHARAVLKCQFCENYVCSSCTRQCSGCFQHFCQLCSVLNYNQVSERAFCFGCNGR